jgi:hypothetical protein
MFGKFNQTNISTPLFHRHCFFFCFQSKKVLLSPSFHEASVVVTRGKLNRKDRFSRSFIQQQRKKKNHETYISTSSQAQEDRSRISQAHGISQRTRRIGQQKKKRT